MSHITNLQTCFFLLAKRWFNNQTDSGGGAGSGSNGLNAREDSRKEVYVDGLTEVTSVSFLCLTPLCVSHSSCSHVRTDFGGGAGSGSNGLNVDISAPPNLARSLCLTLPTILDTCFFLLANDASKFKLDFGGGAGSGSNGLNVREDSRKGAYVEGLTEYTCTPFVGLKSPSCDR